jgi:hypothetical protein
MEYKIHPIKISGPLYTESRFKDVKDPCIVFDGSVWHIYGSGGDVRSEKWVILHATAPTIEGPWKEVEPVEMSGVRGDHVAAPSVYFDETQKVFHMMVQTEFVSVGGTIEYLQSSDGHVFTRINTALESLSDSSESGIYDPHQAVINTKQYIVYAGTPAVEGFQGRYIIQPDVHLAESDIQNNWKGPWTRLGKILDHEHINWHHNARTHEQYEWGIEGPQVICLPNGTYLLNATCFLSEGKFGTRQRVFFAIASDIRGPYTSLGPVINPDNYPEEWQNGENGHSTALIQGDNLYLFFQARSQKESDASLNDWRYGVAIFSLDQLRIISDAEQKDMK